MRFLRFVDRLIAWSNRPAWRRLGVFIAGVLLWFRHLVPGRLLQRWGIAFVRMEAACCRADSAFYKMADRHTTRFEAAGTFERIRDYLRKTPRAQAARRLDAWFRIGGSAMLRHEALSRHRKATGSTVPLLTQAQLALSPACDLSCEGCYTAEDRGGKAPDRERIAAIVDDAASCGAFVIHVIGKGEPFLNPRWAAQLLDVIEARPHLFFTVATHGMRIDDALAARLGTLGNVIVLVAVDGPEPLHDARRGEGSYARVHEAFERLRKHGALFGYSCMVSAKSHEALVSEAFVRAQAEAGCAIGIHSRYFPLAGDAVDSLALDAASLAAYRAAFDTAQTAYGIPLFDLDEVEAHTGCQSRTGESVYIDGVSGQVAPCLRVPFAPDDVRIGPGKRLIDALAHPFFQAYRQATSGCPKWCGANLEGELDRVTDLLAAHQPAPARLEAFRARSVVRLPVLSSGPPMHP